MPGYDGTGPEGTGPYGWGRGPCGEGRASAVRRGAGFRHGRGRGRGFFGFFGSRQVWNDREVLEAEKTWLERRLSVVAKALNGKEEQE
jgi:hypothetical protein